VALPIRHRDALALLVRDEDLGEGYVRLESYRLPRGKGWDEGATRLSGYRAIYQGASTRVTSQVECYLAVADAQMAYRAYQSLIGEQIKNDDRYTAVNEYEQDLLGDWGWAFEARDDVQETYHYIYVRDNVLVESIVSGPKAADLRQETVRLAQVVDQRIADRN
jgi:hypothetical protein